MKWFCAMNREAPCLTRIKQNALRAKARRASKKPSVPVKTFDMDQTLALRGNAPFPGI
jgi:hypothetical protein